MSSIRKSSEVVLTILAYILSALSLLMSIILLIKFRTSLIGLIFYVPKLLAGALSLFWAVNGAVGAVLGGVSGEYWAAPIGLVGASVMI